MHAVNKRQMTNTANDKSRKWQKQQVTKAGEKESCNTNF